MYLYFEKGAVRWSTCSWLRLASFSVIVKNKNKRTTTFTLSSISHTTVILLILLCDFLEISYYYYRASQIKCYSRYTRIKQAYLIAFRLCSNASGGI